MEQNKVAGLKSAVCVLAICLVLIISLPFQGRCSEPGEARFVIYSFAIEGNTLLERETMISALEEFTGDGKAAQDVEQARDALERAYHGEGFPTVLVNIPEQTVDNGVIRLEVIESRIKRVLISGNKYYTMEKIKDELPSIRPGKVLYLPKVREDLGRLNGKAGIFAELVLIPGRELGTIDVELKVKDELPLHGSLELNNRSTHSTTDFRLNGAIRYDNLWQKDHSINAQFQTSPEDTQEVRLFSGSYAMPAPWRRNHMLIGYYVNSNSDTASGEGINVIGKGQIAGLRYMIPLGGTPVYSHNLTLGMDWKDFKETTLDSTVPIEYMPLTFGYASSLYGKTGTTQFSAGVNLLLREILFNDMDEFERKRTGATGNYVYITAGVERRQQLPKGFSLFTKIDGQLADQPLVNNEQFAAGGVNSVRGYKEAEILSDNALHGTLELFTPSLLKKMPLVPYAFYDLAWLSKREASEDDMPHGFIHGIGLGLQGAVSKGCLEYKLDWGMALEDTDDTDSGDHQFYFKIAYRF
ncbi:MAG: ShlB/FhaC/HecB family hemolysin secretion/activation protein [Desulfobacter sp.]|nr:MAG: ShlB/FhaC/HecB family hemolysin secretion/activation protein [Desulfobacter sp.]